MAKKDAYHVVARKRGRRTMCVTIEVASAIVCQGLAVKRVTNANLNILHSQLELDASSAIAIPSVRIMRESGPPKGNSATRRRKSVENTV